MSLRQTFGQAFARSAFQTVDGELRIVGKFGQIALNHDGSFDVWLVRPDLEPISPRKLSSLVSAITRTSWEADIRLLRGEAWFTTRNAALVRETASQLGIRKRRQYSPATLERLREQAGKNLRGAA